MNPADRKFLRAQRERKTPHGLTRVYYSSRDRRLFRWCRIASHWRMRDLKTRELFGRCFTSVEFTSRGYIAMRRNESIFAPFLPGLARNVSPSYIPDGFRPWSDPVVGRFASGGFVDGKARINVMSDPAHDDSCTFTVPTWSDIKQPETTMTLLKLSLLLWRSAHPTATYNHPGFGNQQMKINAITDLKAEGLVTLHPTGYRLTEKAHVFIKHLLAQPLPVQADPKWVMPADGDPTTN